MLFLKGKFLMYLFYQVNRNPRVKKVDGKKFGILMIFISTFFIALTILFLVLGFDSQEKHKAPELYLGITTTDARYGGRQEVKGGSEDYYYIDVSLTYEGENYILKDAKIYQDYDKGDFIKVYIYNHDINDFSFNEPIEAPDERYFPLAIMFFIFSVPCDILAVRAFQSLSEEGSKKQEEKLRQYILKTCIDPKKIKGLPDGFMMDNASSTSKEDHQEQEEKDINDISSTIEERQETNKEQPIQYGSRYMKKASSKGIKKRTDKDMEKYKVQ